MRFKDIDQFDKQMTLLFHGVLAPPLLFYALGYLQSLDNIVPSYDEPSLALKYGVAIFCGALVVAAYYLYSREMVKARSLTVLNDKLQKLYSATIIQFAILEVACFVAVLAFFLTHDHLFTAVYVTILFLMSIKRPKPEKYATDLRLKGEERETVVKKKSLL